MAETYHDDIRQHLSGIQALAKTAIDYTFDLERNDGRFTEDAKSDLIASIKDGCDHDSCPVADDYLGNARPAE